MIMASPGRISPENLRRIASIAVGSALRWIAMPSPCTTISPRGLHSTTAKSSKSRTRGEYARGDEHSRHLVRDAGERMLDDRCRDRVECTHAMLSVPRRFLTVLALVARLLCRGQ